MRLPKEQQRRVCRGAALVCGAIAWLVACGCQGPQFDRLDGSTSTYSSGEPIVDNGPPPAHLTAHDSSASPGADALAQARPINEAAIAENLNCGHREAALNHYEQAEAYYRKALDLDPDNPLANHRLAILADRRADFAVSERCYLKALGREPNNADLLSDLGYSYYVQGRTRESERCLLAAVRVNPTHQLALDNLSLLYAKLGDRERTFEMLKRSLGESAARARLAQLFPPNRTAVPEDDTFTASFAPFSGHETPVAAHDTAAPSSGATTPPATPNASDPRPTSSIVSVAPTGALPAAGSPPRSPEPATVAAQSALEKQLADLMERERQRALDELAQRQASVSSPNSASPTAPAVQPVVATPAQSFTHWSDPPSPAALRPEPRPALPPGVPNTGFGAVVAPRPIPSDRIPDDRINDAFSAIDREGTEGSIAPSSSAETNPGPPRPTPAPLPTPTAAYAPRDQPTAQSRTALTSGEEPAPVAPSPRRPLPTEDTAAPAFPTVATAPTDCGSSITPAPQTQGGAAPARTASVMSASDDWDSLRSGAPTTLTPTPDPNVPTANANTPSPERRAAPSWTAASLTEETQGPPVGATPASASFMHSPPAGPKGWDQDPDPTPQWPGTSAANAADRASSDPAATTSSFDWQANPSPRIVPISVAPASDGTKRSQAPRTADALDEFEAELRKNRPNFTPAKSASNAAVAAKPLIQPLPRDQQPGSNASASGDSSAAGSDPWSLRIQPRRDPPPMFAPDDATNAEKKAAAPKPTPATSGTSWSDLPTWQSPASGNPAGGDNGPAIHPGS